MVTSSWGSGYTFACRWFQWRSSCWPEMDTTFKHQKRLKDSCAHSMQRRETLKPSVTPSESSPCIAGVIIWIYLYSWKTIFSSFAFIWKWWLNQNYGVHRALRWHCDVLSSLFFYYLNFGLFFDSWWTPKWHFHASSCDKHRISLFLSISSQPRTCCLVYKVRLLCLRCISAHTFLLKFIYHFLAL